MFLHSISILIINYIDYNLLQAYNNFNNKENYILSYIAGYIYKQIKSNLCNLCKPLIDGDFDVESSILSGYTKGKILLLLLLLSDLGLHQGFCRS